MKRRFFWVFSTLLLAACDILFDPPPLPPTVAPTRIVTPAQVAVQPATIPAPSSDLVPQPTPIQCAYVWDVRPEPEIGERVQAALRDAGLVGVRVSAEAYGENCLDMITKQVRGFNIMQTDFRIQASVLDLTDEEAVGNWIAALVIEMKKFPSDAFPGPNPGYLFLQLSSGEDQQSWQIGLREANQAVSEGLRGAALLQELQRTQ